MRYLILFILFLSLKVFSLDYYIGADLKSGHMPFEKGYGDNLLRKKSIGTNIYGGIRINDGVGIEIGHEKLSHKPQVCTLYYASSYPECTHALGAPLPEILSPAVFESKGSLKGPYLNVMGFYSPNKEGKIEFIASIGVSYLEASYSRRTLSVNGIERDFTRTLGGKKIILRLGTGFQYKISENLKFRMNVGWMNTKKMPIVGNDSCPSSFIIRALPTNITFYGIGIIWEFH